MTRLSRIYPNIIDLIFNPTFYGNTHGGYKRNRWLKFWDLIGARNQKPSKFECEICGTPMRKRRQRKYMVCQKCLHRYIQEVRYGTRTPVYHVVKVAV
jgi:ribosomal protein L37AE/L43A